MSGIKTFNDLLNSEEYQELGRLQEEARVSFEKEAEDAWGSLDYDWQLRVFYAVVKRIYEGEIKEKELIATYSTISLDLAQKPT